jgi:carboxyl-terminal processing protease
MGAGDLAHGEGSEERATAHPALFTPEPSPLSPLRPGEREATLDPVKPGTTIVLFALCLLGCGGSDLGSVGAVFGRDRETRALVVREASPRGAAGKAGLLPGDQILMIDGWYVNDLDAREVRAKLRGEVGSTVRLTVVRNGDEVHHLRITRRELGERTPPPPPREERITE